MKTIRKSVHKIDSQPFTRKNGNDVNGAANMDVLSIGGCSSVGSCYFSQVYKSSGFSSEVYSQCVLSKGYNQLHNTLIAWQFKVYLVTACLCLDRSARSTPTILEVDKRKTGSHDAQEYVDEGDATCYLLINGGLEEVNWFKHSYASWFIGDYISEDGSLYAATQVDPVFILLPLFSEARMKNTEFDPFISE
ncbi:hypothetical protein CTI12_AA141630 [Artemisia annua]|uniref:Uncharacterized protein n=1 Tax=Artemisia annua TaxID=35608 RepID=A0A2U1PKH5_ARTAN|nr:hypothetical protein CTI12_AA141630 [Artemisia annua]